MKSGQYKKLETDFTSHRFVNLTSAGEVYCWAGGPTKFPCILQVNP